MLGKSSFVPGPGGFPPSGAASTEAQSLGSGRSLMYLNSLAAPAKSLQGKQTQVSVPRKLSRGRTDPETDGSTANVWLSPRY